MKTLSQDLAKISIDGTIIDIETTGLEPSSGYVITVGYMAGKSVRIFQIADEQERSTIAALAEALLSGPSPLPRPYYAYNKGFEESWLGVHVDVDLMDHWRSAAEKLGIKWPKLRELTSIAFDYLSEGFKGHSSFRVLDLALDEQKNRPDVLWQTFLNSRQNDLLHAIMLHNFFDLLREASLLLWDPNQWSPPLKFNFSE